MKIQIKFKKRIKIFKNNMFSVLLSVFKNLTFRIIKYCLKDLFITNRWTIISWHLLLLMLYIFLCITHFILHTHHPISN